MGEDDMLLTVCEYLGVTVLFNTVIYKVPQMYNFIHSGSTRGVSLLSVVLETTGYTIMLTYQFAMGFPFHTYMENILMVAEDWVLVFMMLVNRDLMNYRVVVYCLVYVVFFVAIAMYWVPEVVMVFTIGMSTAILCWSKIDQLYEIALTGDAGELSSVTWFIASYDTGVRMFTTAVITKDVPMFVNLTTSELFNLAIFFSIIYLDYIKPTRRRRSASR